MSDDGSARPAKKPRGSKLDTAKRAEYVADVASAETWDTSDWPTWTVTGRVLPERCDVNVLPTLSRGAYAGGRCLTSFSVVRSHVFALCAWETGNPSIFERANVVRSALAFPVDYIAVQNRGAYEIVLDLCINNRTGDIEPIPILEPIFDDKDAALCFDPHRDMSKLIIPPATGVSGLPTALRDLTSAVRYPLRTFEHCRMAVEAIRQHFDPPTIKDWKKRWLAGEKALCDALRVRKESLQSLEAVAARSRHGEFVVSMNWLLRKRALELVWELVARFEAYLQNRASENWKFLDVRLEGPGE